MSITAVAPVTPADVAGTSWRAPATQTDRRMADALRSGESGALDALHARYGATVFGYLASTLRDRAAAEDVFQLVFTEVWRRGHQYDPERGSLITWMLTIARSRTIDELRRRRPEPLDPATLPETPSPAPQDAALDRWRMAQLLSQLPAEERRLLELRFYGELSQTEIAARTGLALGTIKSRMVRGLERLRTLLDEEGLA
jgi:RNA polymerase sigma-70 factor (ECF subfamily)